MIPFGNTCSSTATCSYPDGVCAIQVAEVVMGSVRLKVKDHICLPVCPTSSQTAEILGTVVDMKISCCNTDLCNAAGPTGGSTWTMARVLLFSLGSVLLQILLEGSSKAPPPLSFYPYV
ncbi:lymphocyte antigen 6B isoform X2 [Rattus norvegicus]|nr:lymphocyte antigen 6B-like isoform X2 [Rattus norvegicus]XP_038936196.1 lymphocyte antigen 6B-like isoform X2 [Rattus norvegicus]XP_038936197.1 lymphocyte antigen 6B-like isoform X2 [Rattus norvegicus]